MEIQYTVSCQKSNQNNYFTLRATTPTPRLDKTTLLSIYYAYGGLYVDGLARPLVRQNISTTLKYSTENTPDPYSISF